MAWRIEIDKDVQRSMKKLDKQIARRIVAKLHEISQLEDPRSMGKGLTENKSGLWRYKQRESGEWIAVGTDSRSRLVELVYIYDADDDYFFVYHGMTPPSGKTLRELGLER